MTDITYTPRGPGCEVRLTTSNMLELVATREGLGDVTPDVHGDPELSGNPALVIRLGGYGANELAYRRLRSPEKRKSHAEAAARDKRDTIAIADLIGRLGRQVRTGWCSGCFERAHHRRVLGRDRLNWRFICEACGTPTTECAVPGCRHFAVVEPRDLKTLRYCAPHRHAIPSFEKLSQRLDALSDYEAWAEFESKNWSKLTKVAGGTIGAAMVIAPLTLLAAPAVGAALGSSALGGGLSGAAATSHGLAMLGGGSIATGGLGVAGGTAVVTATGTALGGALGASTVSAYASSDKSFGVGLVRTGSGVPVVFATGFLTEKLSGWQAWRPMIDARYPDSPVYQLHWGAKELEDIGILLASGGIKVAARKVLTAQAKKGSKTFGSLPGIGAVLAARDLACNPWTLARTRAGMTGATLADLIARSDEGRYVLIGHSLGARVMVTAAQALGTRSGAPLIESMHLLGAAVGKGADWRCLDQAVAGTIWNYYSSKDLVLRRLYALAERGEKAVGFTGFKSRFPSIRDRNVTRTVASHSSYIRAVNLQD